MKSVVVQRKNIKAPIVTPRDVQILNFINEFGFCEMPYLQRRFGLKTARAYQLVQRLIKLGLIQHERVFYSRHGIYRATKKGAAYTSLPPLAAVPVGNYEHQLKIIDVYLKLMSLYPTAHWTSERQLEHDKFVGGIGQEGHLADGALLMPDHAQIAIEVELTQKGRARLEKILKSYAAQFRFSEAWYFCAPSLLDYFQLMASGFPFIKVFDLEGFLR